MINVLLSCDEKYVFSAGVLCRSLVENMSEEMQIHVFESGLSDEAKQFIVDGANNNQAAVFFYEIDTSVFDDMSIPREVNGHITLETYYRLLILEYLPSNVDRVIYLDTDTICNRDFANIYHMDLGEELIAACSERGFNIEPRMKKMVYEKLGFDFGEKYFNAGVILFDLERIRKEFKRNQLLEWALNNQERITFHDQDILNFNFRNRVMWLPASMNCRPFHYYYSKRTNNIIRKSYIIHYGEKPWENQNILYGDIFWKYADMIGNYRIASSTQHNGDFIRGILKRIKHNLKIFIMQREKDIGKI